MLVAVILIIALLWVSETIDLPLVMGISKTLNTFLFLFLVYDLVKQVGRAMTVSLNVIMESITAYLLIGLGFSMLVGILSGIDSGSFTNMQNIATTSWHHQYQLYIYYSFITLTTTGYGDIVPLTAQAKSIAILIAVTGQLYIGVIIAMLVGKYLSQQSNSGG